MERGPAHASPKSRSADAQIHQPPTPGQLGFEIWFGVVLPIVCLVLDPGAFRGRKPMLGAYAAGASAFIFQAMICLGVWLACRRGALLLAGPLLAAGCFAFGLGLLLLLFSLILVCAGQWVGILGFVPFGTAVVYFGHGSRALRAARLGHAPAVVLVVAVISGIATAALPLAAQDLVDRRTKALVQAASSADARQEAEAVSRLRLLGWWADRAYAFEARRNLDQDAALRLDRLWREATGQTLWYVTE